MKREAVILTAISFFFVTANIHSAGVKTAVNKKITGFDKMVRLDGQGLDFVLIGQSLLTGDKKSQTSTQMLDLRGTVKKAFLLWSGETFSKRAEEDKIIFITPGKKEQEVTAGKIWRKNSTGVLYSAFADVSQQMNGSGDYGVRGLKSDPINPYGKDPYSVAGWALVVITEEAGKRESSIMLWTGLEVIRPGELYELALEKNRLPVSLKPRLVGLIGGHGRAGNGSGNLLNGRALSGGDDWDGSSGKFWDIDTFTVEEYHWSEGGKMATLTIDPLLQWLYPVGVVIKLEPVI